MKYLNEEELASIEEQLNIKLPSHYKDFHLNNRALIQELRNSDSVPDDNSMWVSTDVGNIVEYNKFSGIPKSEGPARNKFYIGGDGCGSSCFIDLLNSDNTKVYFVCPDDYNEIFDEQIDDFKWDSDLVLAGQNISDFVKCQIKFNKEF